MLKHKELKGDFLPEKPIRLMNYRVHNLKVHVELTVK